MSRLLLALSALLALLALFSAPLASAEVEYVQAALVDGALEQHLFQDSHSLLESGSEAEMELEAEAGSEAEALAELDAELDAEAEMEVDAEAEMEMEDESFAEMEAEAEAEAEVEVADSAIENLRLGASARAAAYALKKQFPSVRFTSGTRGLTDQARAMAQNVAKNRKWIGQTYVNNAASRACQNWVNANPKAKTVAAIQAGLLKTLNGLSKAQVGEISRHLSGQAFDVQPVSGATGTKIKAAIRKLPKLQKFLEREGGLVRWHAQFN